MKFPLFILVSLAVTPLGAAQDLVVDNWDDALRSTVAIVAGSPASAPKPDRHQNGSANKQLELDFADRKVGAFSLRARSEAAANVVGFEFHASEWGHRWDLPAKVQLQGWMHHPPEGPLTVQLQDGTGRELAKAVAVVNAPGQDGWQQFSAPLTLEGNGAAAMSLLVRFDSPVGESLRVDGVEFLAGDHRIGVTDRSLDEWMAAEKETRPKRIEAARTAGAKSDFSGKDRQYFDQLWLGQDLEKNNAALRDDYQQKLKGAKEGTTDLWSLPENTRLIEAYYELGSHGHFQPARLEPSTEKLLLELLWQRTEHKNDIAVARQSTWWLTGSENHDLNTKASCLLTSRIFMNEPEYRDRIYPDPGDGPGYGYWFHSALEGGHGQGPLPGGQGRFADGKQYRAKDHYEAWLAFFHQYINERVRHGFFLERASAGYMKWTLMFMQSIHAHCGDPALRADVGKFLDLVWADWAQEQLAGIRGGPKTRHHHSVGGYDSMTDLARFFLGGSGSTSQLYSNQLSDDYTLPRVVWNLALDTHGRGSYDLLSQGIGEADPVSPRPPGLERTMLLRPDSRLVRVSRVTPDYILGTQMDHPDAVHTHLSAVGRWQGFICAQDPAARIVTTSSPEHEPDAKGGDDMEIMFRNVQSGSSLVTQQSRRWYQISPQWFPSNPEYEKPVQIWVGKSWDEVVEQGPWTFFRKGNAYAAIRVLAPARSSRVEEKGIDAAVPTNEFLMQIAEHPWRWSDDKKVMLVDDKFSPIIIEAGNHEEYGDLAHFQQAILTARVELRETVVAGFYIVRYKGPAKDAHEILFNAATADTGYVDGKPVSYHLDEPYVSPFIHCKDGAVSIRKGADELLLNFVP